ncbi:hypothetical protein, partial [Polaromonas sp.]|uniref:hypothetical protein n=1 Tax=Polaromonas sp. TaxID=1869339 RepID=UPI003CB7E8FF
MPPQFTVSRGFALALAGLALLGSPALRAQTDGGPPSANVAAAWRASSRLGYAPTPASAQAA